MPMITYTQNVLNFSIHRQKFGWSKSGMIKKMYEGRPALNYEKICKSAKIKALKRVTTPKFILW